MILKKSMTNDKLLTRHVDYSENDLLAYAPVTRKNIGQGMSIAQLCAAALRQSDNTAANLLLKEVGGAGGLTVFARSLGDRMFRLDRIEPGLNSALPHDPRDTTTPEAMAVTLQKIFLGAALAAPQREQLINWARGNTTGDDLIRSGVPADWTVGDKTGSGDHGTTNDIAVLWPPGKAPLILTLYFTQKEKDAKPRRDVLASATRIVLREA